MYSGRVTQLVEASSCTPRGRGFNSLSRHILGLRIQPLLGVRTGGNQSMFLSHIDVSLFLALSLPFSLKLIKNIPTAEDFKKEEEEM